VPLSGWRCAFVQSLTAAHGRGRSRSVNCGQRAPGWRSASRESRRSPVRAMSIRRAPVP